MDAALLKILSIVKRTFCTDPSQAAERQVLRADAAGGLPEEAEAQRAAGRAADNQKNEQVCGETVLAAEREDDAVEVHGAAANRDRVEVEEPGTAAEGGE